MTFRIFILTFLVCFTGCASIFGNSSDFGDSPELTQAPAIDPASADYHETFITRAIQTRDIIPGMSTQEVIAAWGRPRDVDVAGNSPRGNERWIYSSDNSLRYGISQQRIIYFENGRVAGWETR